MNAPQPPPPPPVPFGDPTLVDRENRSAISKGCLFGCGGCLAVMLLMAGVVGSFVFVIFHSIKQSEPCRLAVEKAQASAQVRAALGTPVERGWWVTGHIHVGTEHDGSTGDCNARLALKGPKDRATLHVVAKRDAQGKWQFSTITVTPDATHKPISLVSNGPMI